MYLLANVSKNVSVNPSTQKMRNKKTPSGAKDYN
jgi:hypothetical protein